MKKCLLIFAISFAGNLHAQPGNEQVKLNDPTQLVADSRDNLFVMLKYGIGKITPDGKVTDLRKLDGGGSIDKAFNNLIIDSKNNLYASDGSNIYKITVTPDNKIVSTLYTGVIGNYRIIDGPLATAVFTKIDHMAIDKQDNIYVTDSYDRIAAEIGDNYVTDNYYLKDKKLKYLKTFRIIRKISADGMVSTLKNTEGKFVVTNGVSGMACDEAGNIVYTTSGTARSVEKINIATGNFSHVAGKPYKREWCPVYTTGDTSVAELFSPETIMVNKKGEIIYADERSHRITKIANGKVTTLAGNNTIDPCGQNIGGRAQEGLKDGKALTAWFTFPKGLAYDSRGNLFIADKWNNCIRKLSPDGMVSTFTTPNPNN